MQKQKFILLSAAFVSAWSSGFVIGRMIVDTISPNIFLSLRFFFAGLLFTAFARLYRQNFPKAREFYKHILIGMLCNALYLGPGYWSIEQGLPAGIMALFGGLQPLMTLFIISILFSEKFSLCALTGIALGLVGVYLAIPGPTLTLLDGSNWTVTAAAFFSILSITAGVIIQKYYTRPADLSASLSIQNMGGAATALTIALIRQENILVVGGDLFFALFWGVFILSGIGIYLLMYLSRQHGSVKTTSMLLLCPALTAIQAYWFFDEQLSLVQIIGFATALFGVFLAQNRTHRPS